MGFVQASKNNNLWRFRPPQFIKIPYIFGTYIAWNDGVHCIQLPISGNRLLVFIRLFMLALLSFPVIARDSDLRVQAAEIVGYGVFKTASQKTHRGFTGSAIAADTVTGIQFTDFTKEIVARLGTNFGFQYIINSTPRGKTMPIRSVIKFPAPGLQRPGGKLYVESVEKKEVRIGQPSLHGYGFDKEWELVP